MTYSQTEAKTQMMTAINKLSVVTVADQGWDYKSHQTSFLSDVSGHFLEALKTFWFVRWEKQWRENMKEKVNIWPSNENNLCFTTIFCVEKNCKK